MLDVRAAFVPNQLEIEQEALGGGLKRGFDIVVASLILVVLAPFFVMLTILIKMTDPGPIIYQHSRVGYQGKQFSCVKFRTMVVDSESRLRTLLDADPAVKRIGTRFHYIDSRARVTDKLKLASVCVPP